MSAKKEYNVGDLIIDDEYGTIASDELNAQKSRVLLMLALLSEKDPLEIQKIFYTY